jgi:glycosyltransferase involved in cell wall biosynthesis
MAGSAGEGASGAARRPLRVGLVIGQLSTGGAEGQLRLLCEGFDRAAVQPIVYCLSGRTDPYGPMLEHSGIPVRTIAGSRVGRLCGLRRADGVALVHSWLFIGNAYAWAAGVGQGRPLVSSARNCKRQGRWLDALNRRAFRSSAAIIANSAEVSRYIAREYGAPAERIAVVPNAIDLERFRPQRPADGSRCIVTVGRLVQQKNPLLFVAAAAALRQRLPDARFVMVGDGPLRSEIEAAIRAAGLEGACTLAGERRDVEAVLGGADLFWLTSDWEGLPNAVIEALACGVPVVATAVAGTGDLIRDGDEGFVVPPGDRDALVARSAQILGDPALHARMRAAARARAERFGIRQMVEATQAVYQRALAGLAA